MVNPIRAGFKTSEFWVIFAAGVITALGKALGLPEEIVSWLNGLAIFYLSSRTVVKTVVAKKIDPAATIIPSIILFLTLICFLSGCSLFRAFTGLSSLDRSIVTADRLSVWYAGTHKLVSDRYAAATPEKQAWYRVYLNPKMNNLRDYILGYVDAVNLWRSTGKEPFNLVDILNKIDVLSRDVLFSLRE